MKGTWLPSVLESDEATEYSAVAVIQDVDSQPSEISEKNSQVLVFCKIWRV